MRIFQSWHRHYSNKQTFIQAFLLLGERLAGIWQESSKCKEQKENTRDHSAKVLFNRTSKEEEMRFCLTLYHSEYNNSKAVWLSFYVQQAFNI